MKEIRLLKPNEIECRVQTVKANGCSLLLYKDARVDMKLLDETYGNENWQRSHELIGGNLYCNIDIWDETKKGWIRKQDVGIESQQSSEKGQASDAFKRAGFNIGIGRELYTSPFIWVALNADETTERSGKVQLAFSLKLRVGEIGYDDERTITSLTIVDQSGAVRYSMNQRTTPPKATAPKSKPPTRTKKQVADDTTKAFERIQALTEEGLKDVSKAKDIRSLEAVWGTYPELISVNEFVTAVRNKKTELQTK